MGDARAQSLASRRAGCFSGRWESPSRFKRRTLKALAVYTTMAAI
jgi:hypothetical protein